MHNVQDYTPVGPGHTTYSTRLIHHGPGDTTSVEAICKHNAPRGQADLDSFAALAKREQLYLMADLHNGKHEHGHATDRERIEADIRDAWNVLDEAAKAGEIPPGELGTGDEIVRIGMWMRRAGTDHRRTVALIRVHREGEDSVWEPFYEDLPDFVQKSMTMVAAAWARQSSTGPGYEPAAGELLEQVGIGMDGILADVLSDDAVTAAWLKDCESKGRSPEMTAQGLELILAVASEVRSALDYELAATVEDLCPPK